MGLWKSLKELVLSPDLGGQEMGLNSCIAYMNLSLITGNLAAVLRYFEVGVGVFYRLLLFFPHC